MHPRARAASAARTRWSCCRARSTRSRRNLWINFNLDAQVSANNSNYIGYMGPNAAAKQFIDPAILNDPTSTPSKAVLDQLVELVQLEGADLDKYTSRWTTLTS